MAENIIIHEISLAGYKATSTGGMLDLGTWGSYGIEKLHLTLDAAWQDLTITAFFNVNGKVVAKRVVGKDGYADVPWEATKENTFSGCLAFEGSINGQRRISTNLNYKVTNHSETTDSDPVPTDDRWNQFVTETKGYRDGAFEAAERANTRAEDAETASEDAQAAARAAKASENAAAASASNAAASASNAAASADKAGPYAKAAQAAQEAAENAAAAAAASKSAADTLAAEAARAAKAAENSKVAANNAAYFAGEDATAAQQAAATATAAVNDAGQSASAAAASKAAAETAAKAAQDAQTATAEAKAEAVKAQGAAQAAAKSAQDAQAAAEKVRDDAKTAQKGAEAAQDVAAKSAEAAAKSEANAKQSADMLAESVENVVANTAAVAKLKQQVVSITPDDSTIGEKPWSSKHIIDMLCPPLEESGNPVVCYPVAGYPLGVKAKWEPVQEGSGTPSPENIRPIKGRASVKVERCGENLLNIKPFNKDTYKGITYEYVPDGGIHVSGTAPTNVDSPTFPVWLLPPGKYFGLELGSGIFASVVVQRNGKDFWLNAKGAFEILAGDVTKYWYAIVGAGVTVDKTVYPYIVPGTTAPTTYTPYIGQTNTLTLPETVYGGEVDAVSGEGIKNWERVVFDGTENWKSRPAKYTSYSLALPRRAQTGLCTHFKKILYDAIRPDTGTGETGCYLEFSLSAIFNVPFKNVDDWKNYLAAQYAAGTPVCIVFQYTNDEVNEPFTATGAQPLPALAGANTVLTDADSATVTGRADPIKRIIDLEDAVASQT